MVKKTGMRSIGAVLMAGAASLAIATAAHAQNGELPQAAVSYQIPETTLVEALELYASQTDVDLLAPSSALSNRRAPALSGVYTPTEALRRLLAGTGLTWRVNEHDTLLISDPAQAGDTQRPPQSSPRPLAEAAGARRELPAGDGAITGRIVDLESGAALPGAQVSIAGTTRITSTDDRGYYRLASLPAGELELEVDYLGREAAAIAVTVPASGTVTQNLQLSPLDFVVRGYRSSLARALNQQRTAANASTVVSADLLGEFPAVNVAEAMRRLPGVAFTRETDSGAGTGVVIRGFSSEAIQVQLNGLDIQGTGYSRSVDLSGFLADNISQISIQKSLLPSMEATGSGGLVQIETRTGLDYDRTTFTLGVEGQRNGDSHFGSEFAANATFAHPFTDTFGVVGTLQYRQDDRTNYDVQHIATVPYIFPVGTTNSTTMPSQGFPFDEALPGRLLHGGGYFQRRLAEDNLTASLNFAWDIASHTRLRLDLQHIRRNTLNENSRTTLNFLNNATNALIRAPIPELGGEVRPRFFHTAFQNTMGVQTQDRELEQTTISLRGETNLGAWTFKYKAGISEAESRSDNLNVSLVAANPTNLTAIIDPATILLLPDVNGVQRVAGGGVSLVGDNIPVLNLSPLGRDLVSDPARYELQTASRSQSQDPTEAVILDGSARYTFGGGFIDYVEMGGKYDRSDRSRLNVTAENAVSGLQSSESYVRRLGLGAYLPELGFLTTPTLDLGVIGASGHSVPSITAANAWSMWAQLAGLAPTRYNYNNNGGRDPAVDSGAAIPVRTVEERTAGYLETLLRFGRLEVAGGARYETIFRSGGSYSLPTVTLTDGTAVPREILVQAGLTDFISTEGDQDSLTPSVLATWRHTDQLIARLGYFRSTVHPSMRNLSTRPQYFINLNPNAPAAAQRGFIREGNPDLRPTITDNWDLDVAYYFRDTPGLVRLAVFHKTVTDNFTNLLLADRDGEGVRERMVEYFAPLEAFYPGISNLPSADSFTYQINRPINGAGGTIWGVEAEVIRQLTFLPGFWRDFGVLFNLTYTNGDFPTDVTAYNASSQAYTLTLDRPLADQARWTGTASVNYERGPVSARVLYTYQSVSVDSYSPRDLNVVTPAYDTLDFRASYQFERFGGRFSLYVQGEDLLNGAYDGDVRSAIASTYGQSDADLFFPTMVQFRGGRSMSIGLKATF